MCDRLVGNGMEVVGATPMRIGWQPVRPLEILSWLKAYNEGAGTEERPRVTQFVAVDDRPLLQEHGGEGLRGNAHAARPPAGRSARMNARAPSRGVPDSTPH